MRSIELLAPAKTADIGIEAIRHGADAVYIGAAAFGARAAAGNSVEDIKRLCPEASVLRGFAAFGSRVEEAGDQLDAWLHSLNMAQAREQPREQASMPSKESAMSEEVQG